MEAIALSAPTTACALKIAAEAEPPYVMDDPLAPPYVQAEGLVTYRVLHWLDDRYYVGDDGSVYGPRGRLKPKNNAATGRPEVCIHRRDGKRLWRLVQCLVCAAFHGMKPSKKHMASHKVDDIYNNNADNLYWGTQKTDGEDRKAQGTHKGPHRMTTKEEKEAIFAMVDAGASCRAASKKTGVNRETVVSMVRRRRLATALLAIPAAQLTFASQSPVQ